MHCQSCHKNFASIRYAEVVDGEVIGQQLCRECLGRKKENAYSGFEFTKPSPFIRRDKESSRQSTSHYKAMTCSTCTTTLQSIISTGEIGCTQCYETFPTQIEECLKGNEDSLLQYTGKVPRQDNLRAKARADLQIKRALLKTSLRAERYEEAAILRDAIKQIETGLNTSLQEGGTQ